MSDSNLEDQLLRAIAQARAAANVLESAVVEQQAEARRAHEFLARLHSTLKRYAGGGKQERMGRHMAILLVHYKREKHLHPGKALVIGLNGVIAVAATMDNAELIAVELTEPNTVLMSDE